MDLWAIRGQSLAWLGRDLTLKSDVIRDGFGFLNEGIEHFNHVERHEGETSRGQLCRVYAITLAKSSHLLLGCYSLMLDGLAQEAGALLRPLVETYELLIYLRQDESRVKEVIDGRLPSAGTIGKRISGDFESLRKYLNDNASHFSYKIDSVRSLIAKDFQVKPFPGQSRNVFETNLQSLNAFQVFVVFEVINCLNSVKIDTADLAAEIEHWREKSISVFSEIGKET